jgi:transposase
LLYVTLFFAVVLCVKVLGLFVFCVIVLMEHEKALPEAYELLPQLAELAHSRRLSASEVELAQFTSTGPPRPRIPVRKIDQVLSLTPTLDSKHISQRLRIALSTVYHIQEKARPAASSPSSPSRSRGPKQKLSQEQESNLREWILKMRSWGAEITRTIVRMKALQMFDVDGFRASVSWYKSFLKRNHLHELTVTSSHSSTTGLIPSSSSASSSPHTLQDDAQAQKEQYINFASDFYVKKATMGLDGMRVLALDDMRTSHMHACRVVDADNVSKAKVLSLGLEYSTVNCTLTIHGNGEFGIPVLMFKNKRQTSIESDIPSPSSSSSSSTSSLSSLSSSISLAEDAPTSLPVLTCFTPTVHTTSRSYAAMIKTAVAADLPQGGLLIHDSDGAHLTSLVTATLQQQHITPVVTPRRLTRCGNPGDRVWNALVRQSMQTQQIFYFLSELERNNGIIPTISASKYRSLMLGWFRNAFYSMSLRARQVAFWKAGLMLPDDGSQDNEADVVIASGVSVSAAEIRARVRQKLEALEHIDRISFFSASSSVSVSRELSEEAISRLQRSLSSEMSSIFVSRLQQDTKSTSKAKRKRPMVDRPSKPESNELETSSLFSETSSSSLLSRSAPSSLSCVSTGAIFSSSSSSSSSSSLPSLSATSSSELAAAQPSQPRRSTRERKLSEAGLLQLALNFTFEDDPEWESDSEEEESDEDEE